MPATRRLAAILFADIAGYTRMMQTDEQSGLKKVKRFQKELNRLLHVHGGTLIKDMGDGCLCSFSSAVAAVECGRDLQVAMLNEPTVPLRIGIHLGDVVFEEKNVYGDGVNIAARIESVGVPGSVLFSRKVWNEIKNHTSLSSCSLGPMTFKNVEDPVEVFALTHAGLPVPAGRQAKGPVERAQNDGSHLKNRKLITGVGLLLILAGIFLWKNGLPAVVGQDSGVTLPQEIREKRVAVMDFTNNTGEANLDALGVLASDLVTNGLSEIDIKVCSPQTVRQYRNSAGILPGNVENLPSFSELTDADLKVEGFYFLNGEEMVIKSHLTDATTGSIIRNFPEIKGPVIEKNELVDQLRRRLMGYWSARNDIDQDKFQPPLYEAYQEFLKGYKAKRNPVAFTHFDRANELDPDFILPLIHKLIRTHPWLEIEEAKAIRDSLIRVVNANEKSLSGYEKALLDHYQSTVAKDFEQALGYLRVAYDKYPKDFIINQSYARNLLYRFNNHERALEVLQEIDLEHIDSIDVEWVKDHVYMVADCHLRKGNYDRALEVLSRYTPQSPDYPLWSEFYELKMLAYLGKREVDKVYSFIDTIDHLQNVWSGRLMGPLNVVRFCNRATDQLALMGMEEDFKKMAQIGINWFEKQRTEDLMHTDSNSVGTLYAKLGDLQKELELNLQVAASYPDRMDKVCWVGISYAALGDTVKTLEVVEKIRKMRHPVDNGYREYCMARILCILGQRDETLELLRLAVQEGIRISGPYRFLRDPSFRSLYDDPAFQEIIRPKPEKPLKG